MGVFGRDARRCQRGGAGAGDEIVGALGALPVAALDQHGAAAHREQALALTGDGAFVRGDGLVQQGGGFQQVRRDQRCLRNEFCAKRIDGFSGQQPIAGGCHHHGVEHDVLWRPPFESRGDGSDDPEIRHHADLDRADLEIGEHRIDLRGDKFRGHLMNARDAGGVLRGQRGDDGGAVDAERGKRLQVGLNAGAAGGIRAGDGERDRRHCMTHSAGGNRVMNCPNPA